MIRKLIKINEDKCNGCGLCVSACHEGAIGLENGKAKLLRDDYCDGLGDCLPVCPTGAITLEDCETVPYNEEEVKKNMQRNMQNKEMKQEISSNEPLPCGCPGTHSKEIKRENRTPQTSQYEMSNVDVSSKLSQWPVQIKLVPTNAPYFDNANLLIAADCTAYAYGDFHNRFIKNRITLVGCPKLDDGDYSEKLTEILKNNNIKSVTVVRMEVPCCSGIEKAVTTALKNCGKLIQWQSVTISTDGRILE